jgi:hypothetical protein
VPALGGWDGALRDYFPAALVAFDDLDAADTLELPAKAATSAQAARLILARISAALKRARRRDITGKAAAIQVTLRTEQLGRPEVVAAYAASIQALIAVLTNRRYGIAKDRSARPSARTALDPS